MRYFVLLGGQWRELSNGNPTLRMQRHPSLDVEVFEANVFRIHSGEDVALYTPEGTTPHPRMVDKIAYMINSGEPIPRAD